MAPAGDESAVGLDKVEAFLRSSVEALRGDLARKALKNCTSIRPGQKIAEIQKKVWDDLGVPVDAGRRAVRALEHLRPPSDAPGAEGTREGGDVAAGRSSALLELRAEFYREVDAAYLRCLEDRRPSSSERSGKLQREVVLEFLDACTVVLDTPEVKRRLSDGIRATGALPEDVLNDVHGEVMELLGVEREHGQRCFSEMGASGQLANDAEVAMSYARWRGKNSSACIGLLYEYQKEGGELHVDAEVADKLVEVRAKEELDKMSLEDRTALLERNAKRVNVVRALPAEARRRYLDKVSEQEKLELAQTEILMVTLAQAHDRLAAQRAE